jgi:GntR family transcriptional regulator, transcriptional repressor for pyruvate dehydrogenase complex
MREKKSLFVPIENKRAFEEVSTEIRKQIIRGVFNPGDRLPSETEIARQFNVGRQTVREALRVLELSGFLRIQKGGNGGPVITNTIMKALYESFLSAVQMKDIAVSDLTLARVEVEKLVLGYSVTNATAGDIALLEDNIWRAEEEIERSIKPFDRNINFHILLAKASRNNVFVIAVESIMTIVSGLLSHAPQSLKTSGKVVAEHREILEALKSREMERTMTLMEAHLHAIDDALRDSIERIVGGGPQ